MGKYIGITQLKEGHKWHASVGYKGKCMYVGAFDTEEDAYSARQKFKKEYGIPTCVVDEIGEIWGICNTIGDLYRVSTHGRVKSLNYKRTGDERLIKPYLSRRDGYLRISITAGVLPVHRLVAETFLVESDKYVNHKDGNPQNNYVDNIEYVTQRENTCHGILRRGGVVGAGWDSYNSKWRAGITINGKIKYLGYFDTKEEAHERYAKALQEYNIINRYLG